jgi:hypothetical protein
MELAPIEDFTKVKHTTGVSGKTEALKTLEVRLYLKNVNKEAEAAGYKKGFNSIMFPAPADRYAGQLAELARIIRGEIPYPEGLYEHDLRVHKVSLDAVYNIR